VDVADVVRAPTVAPGANLRVYAMDGALLGAFMVSACGSVALLEHPASPIRAALDSALVRRAIVGLMMGLTALLLIYSPWGRRSGALMNPAVTLAFVRLGKLGIRDALGYVGAQLAGGTLGVALSALVLGGIVTHPSVNFVVTEPGRFGAGAAWMGEFGIGFVLLAVVTTVNRFSRLAAYTGWFAAALVAVFITFEAPLSGMSLNPARTFASAVVADSWRGFWIYVTAPCLGVLAAVELLRALDRRREGPCGKLSHSTKDDCFLKCDCLEGHGSQEP
jgi:aquaporin Z